MAHRFRNRRVLITGASSGIGRASARAFLNEGASVFAVDKSREGLDSLVTESEAGSRLVPIVADVTDLASMEAMAVRALADGVAPDVVVANAGIGMDAPFVDSADDAVRTLFDVNVFGVIRTVRPFVRPMIESGRGRIVLISSVTGRRGVPNYAAYGASKASLHRMADALRSELVGTGVTVGVLCPYSTSTAFDASKIRSGPRQKRTRPGRQSVEEVAEAVLRMAGSRRREMVLSLPGKMLVWAGAIAPALVDRILHRMLVRRSSE